MSTTLERLRYGYDRDSRRTWRGRALTTGEDNAYRYDGLTRRNTRTVGGAAHHAYYSDQWRPLEERKNSQTTAELQYYWGARHRDDLVRRERATTEGGALDETRYVLMDYYSPAAITDETGTVAERYAFSAFGVRTILDADWAPISVSESGFEFAFQGQFLDTESGFLNYGYRYYSPHIGRWLSKDPINEEGDINLYRAYRNNPINLVDFFGLKTCPIIIYFGDMLDMAEEILGPMYDATRINDNCHFDTATATGFVCCYSQEASREYKQLCGSDVAVITNNSILGTQGQILAHPASYVLLYRVIQFAEQLAESICACCDSVTIQIVAYHKRIPYSSTLAVTVDGDKSILDAAIEDYSNRLDCLMHEWDEDPISNRAR